jgi:hypothetical protein
VVASTVVILCLGLAHVTTVIESAVETLPRPLLHCDPGEVAAKQWPTPPYEGGESGILSTRWPPSTAQDALPTRE